LVSTGIRRTTGNARGRQRNESRNRNRSAPFGGWYVEPEKSSGVGGNRHKYK